uniref:Transmembrane protein n=1 Tax=Rousettus aegyptiacus TaxID=9407 RepID=A0A7J8F0A3_ROUAE|nr:hypothetical protein HJG63_012206 [Rousettus aegyptiacus]
MGRLRRLHSANSPVRAPRPLHPNPPRDGVTSVHQSRVNRDSSSVLLFVLPAWKVIALNNPSRRVVFSKGPQSPYFRSPLFVPFHRPRADRGQRQPRVFTGNSLELSAVIFIVLSSFFFFF